MDRRSRALFVCVVLASLSFISVAAAQQNAPSDMAKATAEMGAAATKFWDSLTKDQQGKAGFVFTDPERTNWHFTPVARKGLPWKDMTPEQRKLGEALLHTGMSEMGYSKADATAKNESTLKVIENEARGGSGDRRDPDNYYITLFGKPSATDPWGWRFEGHHVAFNFTVDAGMITAVASPNFLGSNPAKVPAGKPNAGSRILADEEDLGRKLVLSLKDDLKKTAIISETAPREIITAEQQRPDPIKPAGVTAAQLSADQKQILKDLINVYVQRVRKELASQDLAKIEQAGFDKIYFAWAGSTDVGGPHYYRVQGPTFLIEYDNTQNNNNHVHAVWRDAVNDFGEDLLKKHYEKFPKEH